LIFFKKINVKGICSTHGRGKKCTYKILVGKSGGRDHLGDLATDERIILKWVLRKQEL
jgi:hypothetical protein